MQRPKLSAFILIMVLIILSNPSGVGARFAHQGTPTSVQLEVIPVREWYGSLTDFDAAVGESIQHYAFKIKCVGADSTRVSLSHDNPDFQVATGLGEIDCNSYYLPSFRFTPSKPGISIDHLQFSGEFGTVEIELIGNGVISIAANTWIANFSPGTSIRKLAYDKGRDLLYLTDAGNEQLVVFSPKGESVISRINVGIDPTGLSMTPDGSKLYVTNSGEHSISVIDLNALIETEKIIIPTLFENPYFDYEYNFMPNEIAVISDRFALLGSRSPGPSSPGPIYQLDLLTKQISPRYDIPGGVNPVFRISSDYSTVGINTCPGCSPTIIAFYRAESNSFIETKYGLERTLAINPNGTNLISVFNDNHKLNPNLTIFDKNLTKVKSIQLLGDQSQAAVISPTNQNLVYTSEHALRVMLEEANIELGREIRRFTFNIPTGYGLEPDAMVISGDGKWVYTPLIQTWYAPPSKLLAVQVDSTAYESTPTETPKPTNTSTPQPTSPTTLTPPPANTWTPRPSSTPTPLAGINSTPWPTSTPSPVIEKLFVPFLFHVSSTRE